MIAPTEGLDVLNRRLVEKYGNFSGDPMFPMYRIVWSGDQYEHRWVEYTPEGLQCAPYVRQMPKYRQWQGDCFILERCLVLPPGSDIETEHGFGYEPLWAYKTHNNEPVPPVWFATELIIETVLEAAAKAVGTKYTPRYRDPDAGLNKKDLIEKREERLKQLEKELFGNETKEGT